MRSMVTRCTAAHWNFSSLREICRRLSNNYQSTIIDESNQDCVEKTKFKLQSVTRSDVINAIAENTVYKDDHFVVFNKPNGLCTFISQSSLSKHHIMYMATLGTQHNIQHATQHNSHDNEYDIQQSIQHDIQHDIQQYDIQCVEQHNTQYDIRNTSNNIQPHNIQHHTQHDTQQGRQHNEQNDTQQGRQHNEQHNIQHHIQHCEQHVTQQCRQHNEQQDTQQGRQHSEQHDTQQCTQHNYLHDTQHLPHDRAYDTPFYNATQPTQNYTALIDILPDLQARLMSPQLDIAISLNRKYSGSVVLSLTSTARRRMVKHLQTKRSMLDPHMSFLCILMGRVNGGRDITETVACERVAIGDVMQTVPAENMSRSRLKKGEVMRAMITCRTLSTNDELDCSLVEIHTSKDKWDVVEWYCSQKLCRLLGDDTYSKRVATILGVPSHVEPHAAIHNALSLPASISHRLRIPHDGLHMLPVCVHRYRVTLPTLPPSDRPHVVTAPVPPYFTVALDRLGLRLPTEYC